MQSIQDQIKTQRENMRVGKNGSSQVRVVSDDTYHFADSRTACPAASHCGFCMASLGLARDLG